MALDIERIEFWAQAEAIKLKMKADMEKLKGLENKDRLFCRGLKPYGVSNYYKPIEQLDCTIIEDSDIKKYYEQEALRLTNKNQNNEQDNKTDYKD